MNNIEKLSRKKRKQITQESFTSDKFIQDYEKFCDTCNELEPYKFIEPTAGSGNFVMAHIKKFVDKGYSEEDILQNGLLVCEYLESNCKEIIERIYKEKNITTVKFVDLPKNLQKDGVFGMFSIDNSIIKWCIWGDASKYNFNKESKLEELFDLEKIEEQKSFIEKTKKRKETNFKKLFED